MDDMLLFHDDRRTLEGLVRAVEDARHEVRLRLHPWQVMPTRAGVGIVGHGSAIDHGGQSATDDCGNDRARDVELVPGAKRLPGQIGGRVLDRDPR
ncbi:MAG: hypothetical protein ABIY55_05745 [Kofleriaceae bacterium]